jgi:cobalt/nickel transport system permease protein
MSGWGHRPALSLERWSRGRSPIHQLPAGLKLIAILAALAALSLIHSLPFAASVAFAAVCIAYFARIPIPALLTRVAVALPFIAVFSVILVAQGEVERALMISARSLVSALLVLLLVSTTPMEKLLAALGRIGVPALLLEVIHFLWRYLYVIVEQAWRLRRASAARGADHNMGAAATAVAVLFTSSYARAERVHRALLARGAAGVNR